ncbi:CvfB family protein [Spirochaeta cellobiosiphila]|uniref:CvfB family protein n=1 Tax=Spirochaeta cellobiosiphila TaxID=504483 RepID=UPI000403B58C|nr:S1-like domain-containing RNA-binding protein [Spirochaeta cellobiosiphila]
MEIGKVNLLTVERIKKDGAILKGVEDTVFLNRKGFPKVMKEGMTLEGFIYNDGKEGIAVTLKKPYAQLGEVAIMTVKELTDFGAFLDWGIFKDLFLPKRNFAFQPKVGERILVKIIMDFEGKGLIAEARIEEIVEEAPLDIPLRQKVPCLIYKDTRIGYQCLVDNKYQGMLYKDETFEPLFRGMTRMAFIKKVREDGKLDMAIQQPGFQSGKNDEKEKILTQLLKSGGHIYLTDKSDPDQIRHQLKMSKRNFKAVVGMLMREGKVTQDEKGVHLCD